MTIVKMNFSDFQALAVCDAPYFAAFKQKQTILEVSDDVFDRMNDLSLEAVSILVELRACHALFEQNGVVPPDFKQTLSALHDFAVLHVDLEERHKATLLQLKNYFDVKHGK